MSFREPSLSSGNGTGSGTGSRRLASQKRKGEADFNASIPGAKNLKVGADIRLEAYDGRLELSGELSEPTGASILRRITGDPSIRLSLVPPQSTGNRWEEAKQQFSGYANNITSALESAAGLDTGVLDQLPDSSGANVPDSLRMVIPSEIRTLNSITSKSVGPDNSPVEFSESITFPPVKVPSAPGVDPVQQLPDIPIGIRVGPSGKLEQFINVAAGDVITLDFTIPPEVFVETVNVEDEIAKLDCAEANSSINSQIEDLRSRVNNVTENRDVSKVFDLTASETPEEQFRSLLRDREGVSISAVRNRIETKQSNGQIENRCVDELMSQLDEIESNLRSFTTGQNISLGCEDIPSGINTQLDGLRTRINNVSNINNLNVRQRRNELTDLINRIETNVPEENPCRSKKLEETRKVRARLENLASAKGQLPCSSRFSNVDEDISELESRVEGLNPDDPQAVQDLNRAVRDINRLRNGIKGDVNDADCLEQFGERLGNLADRARTLELEAGGKRVSIAKDVAEDQLSQEDIVSDIEQRAEELRGRE